MVCITRNLRIIRITSTASTARASTPSTGTMGIHRTISTESIRIMVAWTRPPGHPAVAASITTRAITRATEVVTCALRAISMARARRMLVKRVHTRAIMEAIITDTQHIIRRAIISTDIMRT